MSVPVTDNAIPASIRTILAGGALSTLANHFHAYARSRGFWDHERMVHRDPITGDMEARVMNPSIDAEKFALIHSEVTEALEAWRDDNYEHIADELADVMIRCLDYMAARGLNPEAAMVRVMQRAATRPRMHGRVR